MKIGVLAIGLTHVIASVAMMFVVHGAYKYANGWLTNREPAYLYAGDKSVLAIQRFMP